MTIKTTPLFLVQLRFKLATQVNAAIGAMLATIALSSSAIAGGNLDLDFSSDVFSVAVLAPMDETKFLGSASFLHHEDDGNIVSAGLLVAGKSKASLGQQTTGIGVKLVAFRADASPSDINGGALAIGGFIHHTFDSANLLSLRMDLYYSPSVVSFGDSDRYFEVSARIEYSLIDNANVYLGYRNIDVDLDDNIGSVDIDDGVHIGVNLQF